MKTGGILGLITARGGSKGLKDKNILEFNGQPLVNWSVQAGLQATSLSRLLISTDSQQIAGIAREAGAEVPFLRPSELAGDASPHILAMLHTLDWLEENENWIPKAVCLLQPTSPLRTANDIDSAAKIFKENEPNAVLSVFEPHDHPYLAQTMDENGKLSQLINHEIEYPRRQALPPALTLNGAIYLNRTESLRRDKTFFPADSYAYVMPAERSLQIDTEWDFRLAEAAARLLQ